MKHWAFNIVLTGYGKIVEEAYSDAIESFIDDPPSLSEIEVIRDKEGDIDDVHR